MALLGLWCSKFFEHAAFYDGMALRIVHGARRFSEDMDFSLLKREDSLDRDVLIELLNRKFEDIDFEVLKADVRPFIKDHHELDLWNQAFFCDISLQLETC